VVTHIRAPAIEAELAADALWQAGASAVVEQREPDGTITLIGDACPENVPAHWHVKQHDVLDDGLDAWRAYARGERAGDRIVVQPPWAPPVDDPRPDDILLLIDPGHSFGSGGHITTRLVLAELEQQVHSTSRVLDVGSGSGVLAVAAARLGAASVVAVDTDRAALAATVDNAHRNGVDDRIDATHDSVEKASGRFDVVVANISARTLRELAPVLIERAAPDGTLVLSGFVERDLAAAVESFSGWTPEATLIDDGWACLVLRARTIVGHAGRIRDGERVPRG